jgi:hypothetical protein
MYVLRVYLHKHAVKNTSVCQMLSLCNMHHYIIYNYTFRPCKWAIIRPKHVVVYYTVLHTA